jgi:hypothetical protein
MTTTNNYDPVMIRAKRRDNAFRWSLGIICVLLLFAVLFVTEEAAAGTADISWSPPTSCVGGGALSECPIVAYNVETSQSATGPWTPVVTTAPTVLSYKLNGVLPGTWFYRVFATSGIGTDQSTYKAGPATAPKSKKVENLPPGEPTALDVK